MSEAEDRDHARTMEETKRFTELYSDWLNARAAALDPRLPADDQSVSERTEKLDAAARALLVQPVVHPWMMLWKWEALESFLELDTRKSL